MGFIVFSRVKSADCLSFNLFLHLKVVTLQDFHEHSDLITSYFTDFLMFVVPCITSLLLIIVQQDATMSSLFMYCKITLHVSGVVAPIIRSI